MSFPSSWLTNTNFNRYKGSYFNNDVDCSGGNIICRTGEIYVDNSYNVIKVGSSIANLNTITTDISYNKTTNTTSISGSINFSGGTGATITFPNNSITNSALATTYMDLTSTQTASGLKKMTDFQINGILYLGSGSIIIPQLQLQNLQYLDVSGSITTSLTNLQNNINAINPSAILSTANTWSQIQSFSQPAVMSGASITASSIPDSALALTYINSTTNQSGIAGNKQFTGNLSTTGNVNCLGTLLRVDGSLRLNGGGLNISQATLQNLQYLSNVTTDISGSLTQLQTNINAINTSAILSLSNTFSGAQNTFSNNVRLDGSLLLNAGSQTLTNANLQKIQYLSNITTDISGSLTTLQTNINNINTSAILSLANTWSQTQTMSKVMKLSSDLQLNGDLYLSNGTVVVANANLVKINYLSNITSDVNTSLNNCAKTGTANTFSGTQNTFSNNVRLDGSLLLNAGATTISNSTLQKLNNLNAYTYDAVNGAEFSGSVQVDKQFCILDASHNVAICCYSGKNWSNGTTSDYVEELLFNYENTGFTIEGGGDGTNAEFGMYYINNYWPTNPTRLPILYGKTTGSIATDTLNVGSNTLAMKSATFTGTLNTISTTIFGYLSGLTSNIQTQFSNIATTYALINSSNIFSTAQLFSSNIQLNGSLILNNGLLSISNTVLQYLQGVSSNIQQQFGTINTTISSINSSITSINNSISSLFSIQPIGTIIQSVSGSLSSPLLLCNGQAVSRTTYSALFGVIGTTYGAGDGSTTFNIPNFQGVFLRGAGTQTQNSVAYTANALGTFQADALQDHNHNGGSGSYVSGATTLGVNGLYPASASKYTTSSFANTGGVNATYRSATETRPANYSIYYYIRAL